MDYKVNIELEEKEYSLVCDLNAMILIEEETGKNTLQEDFWEDVSAKQLRATLWAFLNCHHPELKLKDVGKMINIGNMQYIVQKAMKAWTKAMPEGETEKKMKKQNSPAG